MSLLHVYCEWLGDKGQKRATVSTCKSTASSTKKVRHGRRSSAESRRRQFRVHWNKASTTSSKKSATKKSQLFGKGDCVLLVMIAPELLALKRDSKARLMKVHSSSSSSPRKFLSKTYSNSSSVSTMFSLESSMEARIARIKALAERTQFCAIVVMATCRRAQDSGFVDSIVRYFDATFVRAKAMHGKRLRSALFVCVDRACDELQRKGRDNDDDHDDSGDDDNGGCNRRLHSASSSTAALPKARRKKKRMSPKLSRKPRHSPRSSAAMAKGGGDSPQNRSPSKRRRLSPRSLGGKKKSPRPLSPRFDTSTSKSMSTSGILERSSSDVRTTPIAAKSMSYASGMASAEFLRKRRSSVHSLVGETDDTQSKRRRTHHKRRHSKQRKQEQVDDACDHDADSKSLSSSPKDDRASPLSSSGGGDDDDDDDDESLQSQSQPQSMSKSSSEEHGESLSSSLSVSPSPPKKFVPSPAARHRWPSPRTSTLSSSSSKARAADEGDKPNKGSRLDRFRRTLTRSASLGVGVTLSRGGPNRASSKLKESPDVGSASRSHAKWSVADVDGGNAPRFDEALVPSPLSDSKRRAKIKISRKRKKRRGSRLRDAQQRSPAPAAAKPTAIRLLTENDDERARVLRMPLADGSHMPGFEPLPHEREALLDVGAPPSPSPAPSVRLSTPSSASSSPVLDFGLKLLANTDTSLDEPHSDARSPRPRHSPACGPATDANSLAGIVELANSSSSSSSSSSLSSSTLTPAAMKAAAGRDNQTATKAEKKAARRSRRREFSSQAKLSRFSSGPIDTGALGGAANGALLVRPQPQRKRAGSAIVRPTSGRHVPLLGAAPAHSSSTDVLRGQRLHNPEPSNPLESSSTSGATDSASSARAFSAERRGRKQQRRWRPRASPSPSPPLPAPATERVAVTTVRTPASHSSALQNIAAELAADRARRLVAGSMSLSLSTSTSTSTSSSSSLSALPVSPPNMSTPSVVPAGSSPDIAAMLQPATRSKPLAKPARMLRGRQLTTSAGMAAHGANSRQVKRVISRSSSELPSQLRSDARSAVAGAKPSLCGPVAGLRRAPASLSIATVDNSSGSYDDGDYSGGGEDAALSPLYRVQTPAALESATARRDDHSFGGGFSSCSSVDSMRSMDYPGDGRQRGPGDMSASVTSSPLSSPSFDLGALVFTSSLNDSSRTMSRDYLSSALLSPHRAVSPPALPDDGRQRQRLPPADSIGNGGGRPSAGAGISMGDSRDAIAAGDDERRGGGGGARAEHHECSSGRDDAGDRAAASSLSGSTSIPESYSFCQSGGESLMDSVDYWDGSMTLSEFDSESTSTTARYTYQLMRRAIFASNDGQSLHDSPSPPSAAAAAATAAKRDAGDRSSPTPKQRRATPAAPRAKRPSVKPAMTMATGGGRRPKTLVGAVASPALSESDVDTALRYRQQRQRASESHSRDEQSADTASLRHGRRRRRKRGKSKKRLRTPTSMYRLHDGGSSWSSSSSSGDEMRDGADALPSRYAMDRARGVLSQQAERHDPSGTRLVYEVMDDERDAAELQLLAFSERAGRPQQQAATSGSGAEFDAWLSEAVDQSWNERFQSIIERYRALGSHESCVEAQQVNVALLHLSQDFVNTVEMYGRIIIMELFMERKTIAPTAGLGGMHGDKYIVNDVLFKLAVDRSGFFGRDGTAAAQKVASQELKGLMGYFHCGVDELHVPLMALVDFAGFRLLAMSLLPIGTDTLLMGSADAGRTVHADCPLVDSLMRRAASRLNLKSHWCGSGGDGKMLHSASDLEAHRGTDNRYYLYVFFLLLRGI
jgi:Clustered mitochondria